MLLLTRLANVCSRGMMEHEIGYPDQLNVGVLGLAPPPPPPPPFAIYLRRQREGNGLGVSNAIKPWRQDWLQVFVLMFF